MWSYWRRAAEAEIGGGWEEAAAKVMESKGLEAVEGVKGVGV